MNDSARNKRPLRSDAQVSRKALLTAARELVAERGMEGLTVVAVAERAGLNRSTAYQHFRTREQLVKAVGAEFAAEVNRIFSQPRPFGEQIDFFVDYFERHPDIARTWLFQLLTDPGRATAIPSGWNDYVTTLERLANSSRSQDGIDAEMLGVIGMTSALVWSLMARQRNASAKAARAETRRFARELKRLFLFGALRSERWPDLVAELTNDPDLDPQEEER